MSTSTEIALDNIKMIPGYLNIAETELVTIADILDTLYWEGYDRGFDEAYG